MLSPGHEKKDAEIEDLHKQLDDRRILLNRSGNIAEASLTLNHVFEDAQKAADQYVSEIRRIKEDTEKQAKDILQKARKKAGQDE